MKDSTHLETPNQANYGGASISGNLLTIHATPRHKVKPVANKTAITGFTKSSQSSCLRYTREIPKDRFRVFITLTYAPTDAPSPKQAKKHLDYFNKELSRIKRHSKKPMSGFWIMEFQKNGTIHFHIWFSHFVKYQWIQTTWNRITKGTVLARTDVKEWKQFTNTGLSKYSLKYATKQEQKELPEELKETGAGRWWGKFGETSTPLAAKVKLDFKGFDTFLKFAQKTFKQIKSDFCALFVLNDQQASEMLKFINNGAEIPI